MTVIDDAKAALQSTDTILMVVRTETVCQPCIAMKRGFAKHGINDSYDVAIIPAEDLTSEEIDQLAELCGNRQAPLAFTPTGATSGFRPDVVKGLKALAEQRTQASVSAA